jgi:probable HAF family extracellular repeat protein
MVSLPRLNNCARRAILTAGENKGRPESFIRPNAAGRGRLDSGRVVAVASRRHSPRDARLAWLVCRRRSWSVGRWVAVAGPPGRPYRGSRGGLHKGGLIRRDRPTRFDYSVANGTPLAGRVTCFCHPVLESLMRLLALLFSFFALTSLVLPTCYATTYTVTDLGTLGLFSMGHGINSSGQVTGTSYTINNSTYHAFLYDGTMHDLGTFGGALSEGFGINASGQVAGYAEIAGSGVVFRAFLYDGTMHDLGTLGGSGSAAYGINSSGEVAGNAGTAGDVATHAFLDDGTMHDLGTLGGRSSYGNAINNGGKVAGESDTASGDDHGFLYDGAMHDLGTLGGSISFASSINSSGEVVGSSYVSGDAATHAFLYDGTMHDLGTLADTASFAYGINSSGQVTGYSFASGAQRAFVYDATCGMVDLNSLLSPSSGWFLQEGNAINDLGQITGVGLFGGSTHAFILTPVPEPNTFLLAGLGMMGLVGYARRRRK